MKTLFASLVLSAALTAPTLAQPGQDLTRLLTTFESYAERSRQQWGTPGMAVALIVNDRVVYSKGFGVRQAGGTEPVTPETLFQIGSISKSFTSAMVAQLVDDHKLSWTDHVSDSFPDFRLFDPWVTREFTVEDTMSQRSGMPAYAGDLLAFMGKDRDQILAAMRHIEPVSSFRSQFAYVNNLWLATAKVIEKQTGQSWEDNVRRRLFVPLGMTSSSTGLEGLYSAPNHASPHIQGRSGVMPLSRDWPFARWVYTYGPAGGINSNVLDMARYARVQLHGTLDGKTLLSPASLDRLHAPHVYVGGGSKTPATSIPEVGSLSYCMGWLRQQVRPVPIVWHNGGTSGCKAVVGLVPDSDIAIVVLTNLGGTELPEALMFKFYDLYLGRPEQDYSSQFLHTQQARKEASPVRPNPTLPPLALARYAGTYANPAYGAARVEVAGSGLKLTLGGTISLQCSPWNRDTFSFEDFTSPSEPPQLVTFRLDASGVVNAMELPLAAHSQGGVFLRTATTPQ